MKTRPQDTPSRARLLRGALTGLFAAAVTAAASPAALAAGPAARLDAAQATQSAQAAAVAPPDAPAVMYAIYQIDGKGADSYEVANGSIATYWFGHAFELGGTQYFTGFTWDTRERYGKPGEDEAGPETQVNLAEATFTLTGSSPERPWKFRGMEHTIGMFGAYERPEAIDTRRQPLEYRTPAGKLVLAVPTQGFDNGTSFEGYALFVFNIGPRDELKDKVWAYIGSINTGDDNSAACADGDVMPCVARTGKLTFAAQPGGDMPRITVTPSGSEIAGPGKTRQLGAADAVTYVYDEAGKQYAEK
ncbi:hypothetical protein LMG26788_04871 [Achromobacter pulmonis]|uniref:DUF3472 domain-containing protein n=1 Tax=Achromobacter pulmonis TaxID=1389932 RepID=A0A6S7EH46_9BURK|nr:hypothetical protein [Achromobacter pulmonis]CAB3912514.1 hypothetical protein LMG26788_04871 [Achromobacter pulmonis]